MRLSDLPVALENGTGIHSARFMKTGAVACERVGWVLACIFAVTLSSMPLEALVAGDANCDSVVSADDLPAAIGRLFELQDPSCPSVEINGDGLWSAADMISLIGRVPRPSGGPVSTYFGIAGADGVAISPAGVHDGKLIFTRRVGVGFLLVVEARAGASGKLPGLSTFNPDTRDASKRPDLQIESSRPLGDGSAAVCLGGIPAVHPPDFSFSQSISDALNDFGCNFSLSMQGACTQNSYGQPMFLGSGTQAQFCAQVSRNFTIPNGDTVLTLRVRDTAGQLGPPAQIILRIGDLPTPAPTSAETQTPTWTPTLRFTQTPTRTWTPTATRQPVFSSTPTLPPVTSFTPADPTVTPGRSAVPTRTASRTATGTRVMTSPTPAPTFSAAVPTTTAIRTATRTQAAALTPTRTATPALSPSRTMTPAPSRSFTAVRTPTATRTWTRTPTRTPIPTATLAGVIGPVITYFGVTRADDVLVPPDGVDGVGTPIFSRPAGAGFSLVVEGKPGASRLQVGQLSYKGDGSIPPDLQIIVSRNLGNGSPAVCDRTMPGAGGVPAVQPPDFRALDAVNDLSCRFLDGNGQPMARSKSDSCVLFEDGNFNFAARDTQTQFCGFIDSPLRFPSGDTRVTVRLLDTNGNPGVPAQIIIRVP